MTAALVIVVGADQGRSYPIADGQTLIIGRGDTAQLRLEDAHASRKHCVIEAVGGRYYVSDAGSRGGTLVDGTQIERHELQPGQVLRVGNTELRFQLDSHRDQTTLSPGAPPPAAKISPPDPSEKARPATAPKSPQSLLGTSIGKYKLESILASGNSGLIFKALDTKANKPAIAKVLWPEFTHDDEEVQRFVRAVQTMLTVKQENLIEVYAAVKNSGYCAVFMEYVDGEPLTKVIHRIGTAGMLDWRFAFRVAVHIGRALEAAHAQKIVHRNISPKNILYRKSDEVSKLGGILLAKALEGSFARPVTRAGALVGDVSYMAPERTQSGVEVDGRADIYGLGATVYALLTGRPPFQAASLPELIREIRREDPPKPKQFQLSISEHFQDAVMMMLAKKPEERYESATKLLMDLNRIARFDNLKV